jgi:hypothetical protein
MFSFEESELTACDYCYLCYTNKQVPQECKCLYCGYVEPGVHPANVRKIEDKYIKVWTVDNRGEWVYLLVDPPFYMFKQQINWSRYQNDSELRHWVKATVRRSLTLDEVTRLVQQDLKDKKKILSLPERFWEFRAIAGNRKMELNLYSKDKDI